MWTLISLEWSQTQRCPSALRRQVGAQNQKKVTKEKPGEIDEDVRWQPLVMLGFLKIGLQGTVRKWTEITFSRDPWKSGALKSLMGLTAGSWQEAGKTTLPPPPPAQPRLIRPWVQGTLSAAFPAPPLCLQSLDSTYRFRVLRIQSLPHHQGHTNGWGRGIREAQSSSLLPRRPQRGQTTTPTPGAKERGRWRGKALRTLSHDPVTSAGSALLLAYTVPKQEQEIQSTKAFLGKAFIGEQGKGPKCWTGGSNENPGTMDWPKRLSVHKSLNAERWYQLRKSHTSPTTIPTVLVLEQPLRALAQKFKLKVSTLATLSGRSSFVIFH